MSSTAIKRIVFGLGITGSALVASTCASRSTPDAMTGPTARVSAGPGDSSQTEDANALASQIDASLYLIGDAGGARPGDPVLRAMEELAESAADRSTFMFLGDNLYPDGLDSLGSPNRESDERRLRILAAVGEEARIRSVVLSGNHDWRDSQAGGWRAVIDQQEFIDQLRVGTLSFLPKGGCPGPQVLDLGNTLRVLIVDTAWWLYDGDKAGPGNSECANTTQTEVLRALDEALAESPARRLVVAAHHPLDSGGPHGGYLGWRDHIFPLRRLVSWAWLPLPGIGSLYPMFRSLGVDPQDLGSADYRAMADSLMRVFRRHDIVAYVGGHDHSLQVIRNEATRYSLVSGAGPSSGLTPVAWIEDTEFAVSAWGFMRLDVTKDTRVRLGVYAEDSRGFVSEVYSRWLTDP